ncbi:dinitrogenase iron-molybdenum cofactor [Geitlerinema sp. P-1104]|uniref:NifB/NifX family molybdenum-iron cluster-binding protein n=1 Tax=Geitlerinema sp. P-1104 TaxID=2546230 RepID=UPI0014773C32|nr:NifB/NifX family molybdenum-iron cluster-binding protein [Geitlerinema sp. P-1104]NMG57701.1 dinitrogenase iron-molybdenum cofactor [Geitlerinema sp. P-1104]
MTLSPSRSPNTQTLPEPTARVAVATQGRGLVDTHFGHASQFHIYDVTRSHAEFIEVRDVAPYCHGPENSPGDFSAILETLQDCQAVMISRIGIEPEDRLRDAGIEAVQVYDTIETALFSFYDSYRQTVT